jgi:hypothetical protein
MGNMADTELQQLAKTDRNPVQETRYQELLRTQGSQIGGTDYGSLVRQQLELQKQANAPAVQSLEASIPEAQQKFSTQRTQLEAKKAPLKERYSNLLDELKRKEGVETSTATTNLAREYGKRGIPLSSGVYDQNTQQVTSDISRYYGGQQKDVSIAQEEDLQGYDNLIAQLTGQETESIRAVRNAIAQLQAGGAQSGIQNALSLFGQQQQQSQFQAQQELANKQLALQEQASSAAQTEIVTVGGRKKLINKQTGQVISDLGSSAEGTTAPGIDLSGIIQMLGGNKTNTSTKTTPTNQSRYQFVS